MCAFFMKLFASKDNCLFLRLSTNQNCCTNQKNVSAENRGAYRYCFPNYKLYKNSSTVYKYRLPKGKKHLKKHLKINILGVNKYCSSDKKNKRQIYTSILSQTIYLRGVLILIFKVTLKGW